MDHSNSAKSYFLLKSTISSQKCKNVDEIEPPNSTVKQTLMVQSNISIVLTLIIFNNVYLIKCISIKYFDIHKKETYVDGLVIKTLVF